jgi:hypothetical protein
MISLIVAGLLLSQNYTPDELCQAIGETSNASVQPRDRILFKKNCSCVPGQGCANTGSKVHQQMIALDAERKKAIIEEKKAIAARKPAVRKQIQKLFDYHVACLPMECNKTTGVGCVADCDKRYNAFLAACQSAHESYDFNCGTDAWKTP